MTKAPFIPRIGTLPSGARDSITDVAGLKVGHHTLTGPAGHPTQTGVTVIVPPEDPFTRKLPAASTVFNGFGKSCGLVQLEELGCLETPVALTNTFAVGTIATAQIREAVSAHPEIGREWSTVNPLVLECNDGFLNDIQAMPVTEEHYKKALASASEEFEQGCVGAGTGMSCFRLKGGIGSASRMAGGYTTGVLVLSNFGRTEQCILNGTYVGGILTERLEEAQARDAKAAGADDPNGPEKGSIIMILATDAPLDYLQLRRLSKRCGNGLARTGSIFGHGSGDIAVAFSTANALPWPEPEKPAPFLRLPDTQLEPLFQAACEATEQSIVNALCHAHDVI
ncbi:P1 family peptidase, partial [Desulfovibrio sp. OttesenSCG-928-I05]|nr:P1 family peptidase [Desulfovibrio sp. OttesenSCG-928-I05]